MQREQISLLFKNSTLNTMKLPIVVIICSVSLLLAQAGTAKKSVKITETPALYQTVEEHAYHWWDAFTSRASDVIGANKQENGDSNMFAKEGQQVASQAGSLASQAKDKVADKAHQGEQKVSKDAKDAKREAEILEGQIKNKAARDAQAAKENLGRKTGCISSVYSRIVKAIRGASSELRSEMQAGLDQLHALANAASETTPDWPGITSLNNGSSLSDYARELREASKNAHMQVRSQLAAQAELLESVAQSFIATRLPLAGVYLPVVSLVVIYLVGTIWNRSAETNHRIRCQTSVSVAGSDSTVEESSASQKQNALDASIISTARGYLVIVPISTLLLTVMELNGSPSWLIMANYTLLLAGTAVATQPEPLGCIWRNEQIVATGRNMAIGTTAIAAGSCLIQTLYGG